MSGALLLALLFLAPDWIKALADPSRAVRERAIAVLAEGGPSTLELARRLEGGEPRVVRGVVAVLAAREDPEALPALVRTAARQPDPAGGAGARAVVSIAFARDIPLSSLDAGEGREAIERAAERRTREFLVAIEGWPSIDFPQVYRPLFAGGKPAARALWAAVEETGLPPRLRRHALHAYARLRGARAAGELIGLLSHPEEKLRAAASALILRIEEPGALRALVQLLEGPRLLQAPVRLSAMAAVVQTREVGPRGLELLQRVVVNDRVLEALTAVAALRATYPGIAARVVDIAVRAAMRSDERVSGAGAHAALFGIRLGALEPEHLDLFRSSSYPLLRAVGTTDRAAALELIAPLVEPERPLGRRELERLEFVSYLLRTHGASWELRSRLATAALHSDSRSGRRFGLRILIGAPPEILERHRAALRRDLQDASDRNRLAAARLLAPAPGALQVCLDSVYDGDLRSTRMAASILRRSVPELPSLDVGAPVEERRRQARELRRLLDERSSRPGEDEPADEG